MYWALLGVTWKHLGAILGHLGGILKHFRSIWGVLGGSWKHLGTMAEACKLVYENLSKSLKTCCFLRFLGYVGDENETKLAHFGHLGGILRSS